MINWLERAKQNFQKSAGCTTDVTDERTLTAVLAVPRPGISENSGAGSFTKRDLLNLRDFIYTAYRYAFFPITGTEAAQLYRDVPDVDIDHVRSAHRFLTDYLAELNGPP